MDVLSTLQECSFRGIPFPVSSIQESGSQDMPQHKATDRDGAFVEGTGRNPYTYRVEAPLYAATVARGKNESWTDLYPGTFVRLRTAFEDRQTGTFVHPQLGPIPVKATTWASVLNSDERGGQIAIMEFVETRDDADSPAFTASVTTSARSTALDLDAQLATLNPPPEVFGVNDEEQSFLDIIDAITTASSTADLAGRQALAKIDRTVNKLTSLADTLDPNAQVVITEASGLATDLGSLGPGKSRIWQNCQTLKSLLRDYRGKLAVDDNRTIRTYIVPRRTMLVCISTRIGVPISEILALNPGISRARPIVPADTIVRYYAPS